METTATVTQQIFSIQNSCKRLLHYYHLARLNPLQGNSVPSLLQGGLDTHMLGVVCAVMASSTSRFLRRSAPRVDQHKKQSLAACNKGNGIPFVLGLQEV